MVLSVPVADCTKIPIGSTNVVECSNAGIISLLDAIYAEFAGGVPENGLFSFVNHPFHI